MASYSTNIYTDCKADKDYIYRDAVHEDNLFSF